MARALSGRGAHALELFAPLAPTYDRYAALLSFGQDPRWRRFLVSRVQVGPHDTVLDVATGTAAVAIGLTKTYGCRVAGVDQSREMLATGRERVERAGLGERIDLVRSRAEDLPFDDESFDGVTFTYLLRYVDDPGATLRELARVARRGATVASLEFGVPGLPWRPLWEAYVRLGLPIAGRLISPAWSHVGGFLGESIRAFYRSHPLPTLVALWEEAGLRDVRTRSLSLGGGIVTWGTRE